MSILSAELPAATLAERRAIRRHQRKLRQSLSPQQRACATDQITAKLLSLPALVAASDIALFLAFDGEPDMHMLITTLWQLEKRVWLPTLHPFSPGNLLFVRYTAATKLRANPFQIMEPLIDVRRVTPLQQLDVMLIPLVAFDHRGYRLGMGRGYYDRTLASWQRDQFLPIGIAYDHQCIDHLPTANWDIPLPTIVTPSTLWQWPIPSC